MIWFIAIGAVIVRGAVADATWDQERPFLAGGEVTARTHGVGCLQARRSGGNRRSWVLDGQTRT
jgi:hypothetical protein